MRHRSANEFKCFDTNTNRKENVTGNGSLPQLRQEKWKMSFARELRIMRVEKWMSYCIKWAMGERESARIQDSEICDPIENEWNPNAYIFVAFYDCHGCKKPNIYIVSLSPSPLLFNFYYVYLFAWRIECRPAQTLCERTERKRTKNKKMEMSKAWALRIHSLNWHSLIRSLPPFDHRVRSMPDSIMASHSVSVWGACEAHDNIH